MKKRILILMTIGFLILAVTSAIAFKGKTNKRAWVKSPGQNSYLITCNPGETFHISITSEKNLYVFLY